MSESKAWWRTGAGIAAWLILAVTTAGIAWAAVAVVADQGDDPASVAVPESTPTTTSRTPVGTTDPSTDPSDGPDQPADGGTRVISSRGGTVSVTCTGPRTIQKLSVTPAVGWLIAEDESEADEVRVEFSKGDHGGEDQGIRARCEGGVVQPEVD